MCFASNMPVDVYDNSYATFAIIFCPSRWAKYCDQCICMFVCLFVYPLAYLINQIGLNRPESKMICMFRRVRLVAAPEAKSAVSDYILNYFCVKCEMLTF